MTALIDRIRSLKDRVVQAHVDRRTTRPERAQRRAEARAQYAEDKRRRDSEPKGGGQGS